MNVLDQVDGIIIYFGSLFVVGCAIALLYVRYNRKWVDCSVCDGSGETNGAQCYWVCTGCNGAGRLRRKKS